MTITSVDPRYPIGKFQWRGAATPAERAEHIARIAACPTEMRGAVRGLNEQHLDTPYREGGWTVRQVVHHVPDSHMNAYIRFKLGLTEETPTIKPYDEHSWAQLADSRAPVEMSLDLLELVHMRWMLVLRAMRDSDFQRMINHPESGVQPLDRMLALYAWHGAHHTAHVTSLRAARGW
ncbi:MAG: YfiT family bacillithiol transferase [Gemmatimonadaceae bacterium]